MTLASPFNINVGVFANPEIAEGPAFGRSPTAGLAAPVAAGATTPATAAAGAAAPIAAAPIAAAPIAAAAGAPAPGAHHLPGRGDASDALLAAGPVGKPDSTIPESIGIPESSSRLGHFELLVVVSEMSRQTVAPPLLREVSLDDVSSALR